MADCAARRAGMTGRGAESAEAVLVRFGSRALVEPRKVTFVAELLRYTHDRRFEGFGSIVKSRGQQLVSGIAPSPVSETQYGPVR